MRKLLIFLLIGLLIPGVAATKYISTINGENISVGDSALFIDNGNNRVGIGNSAPTAALDVSGNVTVSGYSYAEEIRLGTNNQHGWLDMEYDSGPNKFVFNAVNSVPDLQFRTAGGDIFFTPGGANSVRFSGDGNVSIGTDSPTYPFTLFVNNTANLSSSGMNLDYEFRPTNAATGTSIDGFRNVLEVPSGVASNVGSLYGTYTRSNHYGSGTASSLYGTWSTAWPAGTTTSAYGVYGQVAPDSSTVTSARGVAGVVYPVSSTVTTAQGGYFAVSHSGGSITDGYGVYIDTVTGTNEWGLYQSDASNNNYFAGSVGVKTTGPDRALDVLDASNAQVRLTHTDGSVYSDLQTDSSGYLVLSPSGGRVGIGATPTQELHVAGDIYLTGGITFDDDRTAVGKSTTASAADATAFGDVASASAAQAVALGPNTVASGIASLSVGYLTEATGQYDIALGAFADAKKGSGLALGYFTVADYRSTAVGSAARALGNNSLALGYNARSEANFSGVISIGSGYTNTVESSLVVASEGTAVQFLNSSNVGVFTTSPTSSFEVNGTFNVTEPTSGASIEVLTNGSVIITIGS